MAHPWKNMEKTMPTTQLSSYDSITPWQAPGKEFHIRGFALREEMPPVMIHHGEKRAYPWPWLLVFFNDPVRINPGTPEEIVCEESLMIWPPGARHHYGNETRNWTHSWMIVDFPEMEQLLKSHPLPVGSPLRTDADRLFARYLPLFHEEGALAEPDLFFQKNLLQLFLYELHRQCKHNYQPIPHRIQEMERYLRTHIREELTLEGVAAHFGLSTPHFAALFREQYRVSPMQYLNTLRMNKAARLLRLYPYSCKEVAERTGFGDPLYFSRRFRQFWGVSPRDYRNREGD